MKWNNERSNNVEDRRGSGGGKALVGGGIGTLIIAAIIFFMGGDPSAVLNSSSGDFTNTATTEQRELTPQELKTREMVEMIAAWNDKTWEQIFSEQHLQYTPPKIVMFSQATQSGCGPAQSAMGPFYCPADQKIYVDMTFFNELEQQFGAKVTEFTVAYVLGHEVGHHVQTLLGTTQQMNKMRSSGRYSEQEINKVSVAVELQADFFAGVWAKQNNERTGGAILEPGDIEAAVSAAQAVGDDNIQKRAQGYVNQEAFTHGSSKQRVEWFMKGYNSGDINQGDTFKALLN
ncbi:neutral zinc metallopeptidase [Elizabethkingia sp. JS20170427COW]|uniref:KPN_02809 family neutral zinc metallopeptidase n=1 Tax=Elizabethkingia sp. JS20170427COW TaxID=2583851 RepID=UPI0011109630|nr:neutral zinc metallopeptidase [Elizabethkingia sp. JS20170427COW]QCX53027.1 metalloprotease [Elizabethkingia sp. JS20170427COW]